MADIASSASGVVDVVTSEEAQGDLGPHRPFGTMTVEEAWEIINTRQRMWFPIPIAWRGIPELQGTAIFFNKYPNVYDDSTKPDMNKIYALEPSIMHQDLSACRANIKRIGPRLLETVRRTTVPHEIVPSATQARISIREVPPTNPFPTHVLVIEQHPPVKGHRHRTSVPVHDVVILSFLCNVRLPPRLEPNATQTGDSIELTVPIGRLAIPNPKTFDKILTYMYSGGKASDLMNFMDQHMGYCGLPDHARVEAATSIPKLLRIPFLKPEEKLLWTDWSKQTEARLAAQLSMTYCYERLINLMKDVNLQFENIRVLKMWDNTFEAGILLSRRLLLSAMTLSVVRDHLV